MLQDEFFKPYIFQVVLQYCNEAEKSGHDQGDNLERTHYLVSLRKIQNTTC